MRIRIKNLRLRTIVGVQAWEREAPQDVVVNIDLEFDGTKAAASDDLADTVDYKALKARVMQTVETSRYQLLEKLAAEILRIVLSDSRVLRATIEVDKPHALRFADSVSIACSGENRP
jgi:D-erythro-7,8-dihydroneopterin triphosphate epimerase